MTSPAMIHSCASSLQSLLANHHSRSNLRSYAQLDSSLQFTPSFKSQSFVSVSSLIASNSRLPSCNADILEKRRSRGWNRFTLEACVSPPRFGSSIDSSQRNPRQSILPDEHLQRNCVKVEKKRRTMKNEFEIPPEKLGGRSKYRGQNLAHNHFARRYSPALPDVILVTRLRLQYQLLHGSRSNLSDRASKYYNAHVRKYSLRLKEQPVYLRLTVGAEAAAGLEGEVTSSALAINVRNLGLSVTGDKGEVVVLKECSLQIPEGQLWMLLGPNGCGKSTLLKAMAGLLRPNRGKMFVVGPRSFVFQNPEHQVVMPTAEADVAFGLGRFNLSEDEVRTRVYSSLEAVGMSEYAQRPIQTLSGGQKQRVAIAGALAESSRVLLLDELTTFLDEGDQMGVLEAVRKVVGGAVTALWVTHRLEELEYADGAVYMENGKVVLSGGVKDIKCYIKKQQDQMISNGVLR